MKKNCYSIVFYFRCCVGNGQEDFTTKLWTKSFFAFKQSTYNKQWLGVEHLTWLVILVLTTSSTIKGPVVWDNKFILAYGLK
jgi:hypothetical protein